jgi:hypothetical protein
MGNNTRTEIRLKQDFLRMLTVDMANQPESFHICENPSSPTLTQISKCIYPTWEYAVEQAISEWAVRFNVGVPDFTVLAAKMVAA